ncbi:MAG: MFS transporter [Chloroflexi bacterium]|nr:MFS transporter [Chloroflexota bacterium]
MSLRANRDFVALLSGQTVSALGDAITLTTMPLLVLFLTGSAALMGIVGALQLLPDLFLGIPAGALADRWDRRRMMILADTGRAILTMAIPVSHWLDGPTMAVILVVAFPINVLRVVSDAAYSSSIPALVGRENLGRAYSTLEATLSVPFIIGPAIAGLIIGVVGPATTIAIDAVTFAVSAAAVLLVRRSLRAVRAGEMPTFVADIRAGLAFVWKTARVRTLIAFWAVLQLATAALIPTLGYFVTIDRSLGPELFGFIGSAWSGGYLAGSLLAGRLGDRWMWQRLIVGGIVLGASILGIAVAGSPALYLAGGVAIGASLAVVLISYATLRASATPDELQGRVGSTARAITLGLMPLGMLVTGGVIEVTDATTALLIMGGLALAASVLFGLARQLRGSALAS